MALKSIIELSDFRDALAARPQPDRWLWVCGGSGCQAAGSRDVLEALRREAAALGLENRINFKMEMTGCMGLCQRGPLVETWPEGYFYQKVRAEDAPEIVAETLTAGRPVERLTSGPNRLRSADLPFCQVQHRLIMARMGHISPFSLEDYLMTGGYEALAMTLAELSPAEVARRVEQSGLRGRGGGGFPAGRKWRACREAEGAIKYVLANGDEGDPGAFMNRSLMEGDPQSIIEGMILGAYAVGANQGYIYVRHEYTLSVATLNQALDSARDLGFLGPDILGSGFDFDLEVVEGGGAFVCGESTALMNSIEGREGLPRVKYVRSTEKGLWERPTLLQNVETWANVPHIVLKGPDWFRSIGSENNSGTKIFALVGEVRHNGLVEMPLGSRLRSLVDGAGGGAKPGRTLKAVQSGGPSGGCLPESLFDLPVDFDHLVEAGAMMGSGGLIVMDDLNCLVDVARYFTKFLMEESCGKCVPCREGLPLMAQILDDLCQGQARPGDTARLAAWAEQLSRTALCALGQSAANPIVSTIKYFNEEYREHEEEGYCRSGRCQGLYVPLINPEICNGCGACHRACPASAIDGESKKPHQVRPADCVSCGACLKACRFRAVTAVRPGQRSPREVETSCPN